MPQDVNPGEPSDLTADDLDSVAGGTFHTEFESGSELNIGSQGGGAGAGKLTRVEISNECLNPQPLPP
jgi:hypothetical protein